MGKIKIPYFVAKKNRDGGERYYWQPSQELRADGWRSERLPDTLTGAIERAKALNEQVAAWRYGNGAANGTGEKSARPGSIHDLVLRYKKSRFFTSKRPATQRGYNWALAQIEAELGADEPVVAITPRVIERLYGRLCKRSISSANTIMRSLQAAMKFAVKEGLVATNPAAKMGLINPAGKGVIWPEEAVDLLVATADALGRPSVGDAIELAYWLAQRPTDILRLDRRTYRAGTFSLQQSKTGARVMVPHSPRLAKRMEAALQRPSPKGTKILATTLVISEETGRPYEDTNFSHVFATVRAAAAKKVPFLDLDDGEQLDVSKLQFRNLRHTGVTRMGEAGCEIPEIAAVSGHTLKAVHDILDRYLVRTAKLAQSATDKRLAAEQAKANKEQDKST